MRLKGWTSAQAVVALLLVCVVGAPLSTFAQAPEKNRPAALELIEHKRYREALDELVKAVGAEPENPKVYATLSLLYLRIEECSLAWKYYRVAGDLQYEDSNLLQDLSKLCNEPKEKEYKEQPELVKGKVLDNGQVDQESGGTLLWVAFPPEQSQWPSEAKLPLIQSKDKGSYWELTLAQMRKVRELTHMTLPWIMISSGKKFKIVVFMNRKDDWIMVLAEPSALLTQP